MRVLPPAHAPLAHDSSGRLPPPPRAFTLIEILIAVLILALGILGLGAVFPAVIREQRLGAEAIYGSLAGGAAERTLANYDFAGAMRSWIDPLGGDPACRADGRSFWRDWRDGMTLALGGLNHRQFEHGKWLIPTVDSMTGAVRVGYRGAFDPPTVCPPNGLMTSDFEIPLTQRLYPAGAPLDAPPQYVWDLAVHRLADFIDQSVDPTNDATRDPLQVVVFVRRIDSRIRIPATSLYRALTTSTGLVPVGSLPTSDLPSNDGTGSYSLPVTVDVQYLFDRPSGTYPDRDRLYLPGASPERWLIVRQNGQKLVDNLGNVYTVVGYGEDGGGGRYVRVDPPVDAGSSPSPSMPPNATIIQVICTPQVPAAVVVLRVDP